MDGRYNTLAQKDTAAYHVATLIYKKETTKDTGKIHNNIKMPAKNSNVVFDW